MQDIRADLVTLLDQMSVTHQGASITLNAGYYSDISTLTLPAIFVREVWVDSSTGDVGDGVELFEGRYDLAIVCIDRDDLDGETFLAQVTSAINTKIRANRDLGGAWRVVVKNYRDMRAHDEDGVLVYERVVQVDASSVDIF